MVRLIARRNLSQDRFGTIAAVVGVALGTATVSTVLTLDVNTSAVESGEWSTNPALDPAPETLVIQGYSSDGQVTTSESAKEETHEDYEVMRSAIRLGSLTAFLVGALVVFFTFSMMLDRRRREVALLRSLGASRRQVAHLFFREAAIVGIAGALLGTLASVPLTYLSAAAGITTTGRANIDLHALSFPWAQLLVVAAVGVSVALLGVVRPAREALSLDVPTALSPGGGPEAGRPRKRRSVALLALPMAVLLYVSMRPFFADALPSLTFFVIEATIVMLGFLATVVFVPDLVRGLGGLVARGLRAGPAAARLVARRRIERSGEDLSWSVSGVMLVFSLMLALHVAVGALVREVSQWGDGGVRLAVFVKMGGGEVPVAPEVLARVPDSVRALRFSGRTPWPNAVHAVAADELRAWARATGKEELEAMTGRFRPGTIILSSLMARRHHVTTGDSLELELGHQSRRFEIVGVTDDIGFTPMQGPYRYGKTYGVIEAGDYDLIAPAAGPLGTAVVLVAPDHVGEVPPWRELLSGFVRPPSVQAVTGERFIAVRQRATAKDFFIFDLILALTTVLAAVGIANQLLLSLSARSREVALYRVLGMTRRQVRWIVLLEGGFVGGLGGLLAVMLGVPLGYAVIGALRAVSAFEVQFELPPWYALATFLGAVGTAVLSSLVPARRVAQDDEATRVHYE